MRSGAVASLVLVGLLLLGNRAAHAQFAVIDVASLAQLMQQVQTLEQQVQTAQAQLTQARNEYAAITGSRGMQLLLSGTVRNYLPVNSAQLSQVMSGSSATFPGLAGAVRQLMGANAVLTPAQVASLSPPEQARVISARRSAGCPRWACSVSEPPEHPPMGFFAEFNTWLNTVLTGYSGDHTARIAAALEPAIITLGVVYVMIWGYLQLTGQIEEPFLSGVK